MLTELPGGTFAATFTIWERAAASGADACLQMPVVIDLGLRVVICRTMQGARGDIGDIMPAGDLDRIIAVLGSSVDDDGNGIESIEGSKTSD